MLDDEAEVDDAEPAIILEQEIAGMQIGVREPARVDHASRGADDLAAEFVALFLRRIARQELIDVDAREKVHCQDPGCRILRINARHNDAIIFSKQDSYFFRNGGLRTVVGFSLQPGAQIVKLVFCVLPVLAEAAWQESEEKVAEVFANGPCDAGILNLDGDVLASL